MDSIGSLAKVEEWLWKSPINRHAFRVHRASLATLESRVSLLELFLAWQRNGSPFTKYFGPKCVVDL